ERCRLSGAGCQEPTCPMIFSSASSDRQPQFFRFSIPQIYELTWDGRATNVPRMKVNLAYGQAHLTVELPDDRTTVIEPSHTPGLADERNAVFAALDQPSGAPPLRAWIKPGDRICILFT